MVADMIFDEIYTVRSPFCLCFIASGLVFMYGKRLHHRSRESGINYKIALELSCCSVWIYSKTWSWNVSSIMSQINIFKLVFILAYRIFTLKSYKKTSIKSFRKKFSQSLKCLHFLLVLWYKKHFIGLQLWRFLKGN